jgi:N4-gp56 family major capsid protein
MAVTNYSALSNDARTYIAKNLILLAKYYLRFYDLADKQKLPPNSSKTMRFVRYPDLGLPVATLTEGSDPTARAMTNTYVDVTVEQWGDVVQITDVAELTISHPVLSIAQDLLARQAARTMDREIQKVLQSGTSVWYATGVAARSSLIAASKPTASDIRAVVSKLRTNGAEPYDGEMYVGVLDPAFETELLGDTTFVNANAYAGNLTPLMMGEVGKWMGVRWIRSNFIPALSSLAAVNPVTSATGGSLANGTTYYCTLVARNAITDFETIIYQEGSGATGGAATSMDITMPSDTNYTYDVYFGASTGACYLSSSRNAAAAVVNVKVVPASSAGSPQVAPAVGTGINVHTAYIFGRGSFVVTDLQNLSFHLTPNQSLPGNVLQLSRYAGWKVMFKSGILANEFMYRIEGCSAY